MRLVAYVGRYADGPGGGNGGIDVVPLTEGGAFGELVGRTSGPAQAGYLVHNPLTRMLYAVNESRNDGRGPLKPPAALHAFRVGDDGALALRNTVRSPGPFPTYLSVDDRSGVLVSANHGGFDHVERVVRAADGWTVQYEYDDSTVVLYELSDDGDLVGLRDVVVTHGHGPDPNTSPQMGGHAQASSHPHSAVIDPSGRWVVVADKGADTLISYRAGATLVETTARRFPPQTGPRHLVFDGSGTRAFMTCEFASTLTSMTFDPASGSFTVVDEVPSVGPDHRGLNEPADVRIHRDGRFVYVNNRGEDSLAWFAIADDGTLERRGSVDLAESEHPGVAARSFSFDPTGSLLLIADRPANAVRSYAVDADTGALTPIAEYATADPAFVAIVDLDSTEGVR